MTRPELLPSLAAQPWSCSYRNTQCRSISGRLMRDNACKLGVAVLGSRALDSDIALLTNETMLQGLNMAPRQSSRGAPGYTGGCMGVRRGHGPHRMPRRLPSMSRTPQYTCALTASKSGTMVCVHGQEHERDTSAKRRRMQRTSRLACAWPRPSWTARSQCLCVSQHFNFSAALLACTQDCILVCRGGRRTQCPWSSATLQLAGMLCKANTTAAPRGYCGGD